MDKLVLVSSIKHKEKLNIDYKGKTYFGGNQSWYQDKTKVFGGCGPICAYNLLNYYGLDDKLGSKNESIIFKLNQMYRFIKPTEIFKFIPKFILDRKLLPPTLGVRSLSRFKLKFIKFVDQNLPEHQLKIREFRFINSSDSQMSSSIEFISSALDANQPLCFLDAFHFSKLFLYNDLSKGKHPCVDCLEDLNKLKSEEFITHWVLVTGLYKSEQSNEYYLECSTWGRVAYFKLSDFYQKLKMRNVMFHSGMLRIEL